MKPSALTLARFRVTNFRSVEDSDWIDVDEVGALIGTNESGKTNLLIPLWKLNPAKNGAIESIADYPRKRYNEIRSMTKKPVFIHAEFTVSDALAAELAPLMNVQQGCVQRIIITRDFDGNHDITFPDGGAARVLDPAKLKQALEDGDTEIQALDITAKADETLKSEMRAALSEALDTVRNNSIDSERLTQIKLILAKVDTAKASKRSLLPPLYGKITDLVSESAESIQPAAPEDVQKAQELILKHLPSFVYYSNYGNLDSEIYLPHVIENMTRQGLGLKDEAKARTLKVLFEFVRLQPKEILELGQDFKFPPNQQPTPEQIDQIARKKKERSVLLQSASTELTTKFREWWKQGEYRIRFEADGDHFRIWISDDKRPEEIELEARSTGLQWFLSFYLVFLVESTDAHEGAILLLDEPGLSLHALAQRDLSSFFESLAKTNQLIYTTHSPFMVDPNHLDRVKAVYVDDSGLTCVSANLRAGEVNSAQTKSIYPVHAALGLSVSDTLLQGCQPVIVEGTSDQHYLSAIKNYLISRGLLMSRRELVFVPGGGVRGIGAVISVLSSKNDEVPFVLLDSDASGRGQVKKLRENLYQHAPERVLQVADFITLANAEVEDLFPVEMMGRIIERFLPRMDIDFADVVRPGTPIVSQIERFAANHQVDLEPGWKVELAKRVKAARC